MTYGILAYTYNADLYCPTCVLPMLGEAPVELAGDAVEEKLDYLAPYYGVTNRDDESSFDSGTFPKRCYADQLRTEEAFPTLDVDGEETADRCGSCGDLLVPADD